jgi:hypothetical protein
MRAGSILQPFRRSSPERPSPPHGAHSMQRAIHRIPGPPHTVTRSRRCQTLYWIALSAGPSPAWRAAFLRPPLALRNALYTREVGRLMVPGARVIFRTGPPRLRQWLRRIDRWIVYANSVVAEGGP